MTELDPILEELPPEVRAEVEREAARRNVAPLAYLEELITQDLGRRTGSLRDEASHYRFATEGDFDLKTLKMWLARRG